ncbi:L-2-amino-thiazoline-4-carboxylic acid hydrolase [Parvibaculum sp.]|uniref:L-2-amino-thiazoline-4-carboxylic acid hydrolase n=1 Tax=Parvibaculum sp. TaxID=2024848 RepID=UPI000C97C213|nr:L-2-amino-thiazoline-4-carboxylic acid hydrolase [Parvibaculum sp.]MAB12466.1 hypothetical protein [Parvibaculum sp.]
MAASEDKKRRPRAPESPEERFRALSPDRQAQLLDPAETEFAEHGFDRASLNRILERAGISKGQVYHYARDKAALYRLVVDRALNRIAEEAAPVALKAESPDAFWDSLSDVLMRATLVMADKAQLAELAKGIYSDTPLLRDELAPLVERVKGWVRQALETGQAAGAVRRDMPITLLVANALGAALHADRWFVEHWSELTDEEVLERTQQSIELCRNMLAPAAPPATQPDDSLMREVEAQAEVLVPVLHALRAEIGEEKANRLVLGAVAEERRRKLQCAAQNAGGPGKKAWASAMADLGRRVGDSVDYKWLRQEEGALDYDVTSCAFAQLFRAMDEPDLGRALVCDIDTDMATANAPNVELTREQTLMQGAPCCTFRYRFHPEHDEDEEAESESDE